MQPGQSQTPSQPMNRMHWMPVEPSWLVSIAIIVLAVLPHQIPRWLSQGLQSRLGGILFAAASLFIFWKKPVLGIALILFLAAIRSATYLEGFVAQVSGGPVINKDTVTKSNKWLVEEVLDEDPMGIQERTEGPGLTYDSVKGDHRWLSEEELGEHPEAIQERTVGSVPQEDTSRSSYMGHHR